MRKAHTFVVVKDQNDRVVRDGAVVTVPPGRYTSGQFRKTVGRLLPGAKVVRLAVAVLLTVAMAAGARPQAACEGGVIDFSQFELVAGPDYPYDDPVRNALVTAHPEHCVQTGPEGCVLRMTRLEWHGRVAAVLRGWGYWVGYTDTDEISVGFKGSKDEVVVNYHIYEGNWTPENPGRATVVYPPHARRDIWYLAQRTTPPTPEEFHPQMLLTRNGPAFAWADGHQPPFEYRERGICCSLGRGKGWPMMNAETLEESANLGRTTMVEFRPGPFNPGNEPDWRAIGGAYASPDGVRADLTQWNPVFWRELRSLLTTAGRHGIVVRIVLIDMWWLKTKIGASFDEPPVWIPWAPGGNIQGEDHSDNVGGALDPVQEAWVRKVVRETGAFGNVLYEDAVEPTAHEPYRAAFSIDMERIVRDEERAAGYRRHLWGSNATKDEPLGQIVAAGILEFNTLHELWTPDAPWNDVPTLDTEYNPEPPWECLTTHANFCYAKKRGVYYAAWAHGQGVDHHTCTLGMNSEGCTAKEETGCPFDVRPLGRIDCRRHSGSMWDCTAKGDDGRPILPEGNGSRVFCELSAGAPADDPQPEKGRPYFWVEGGSLQMRGNPWQFVVTAPGKLRCSVPRYPGEDLCGGVQVTP